MATTRILPPAGIAEGDMNCTVWDGQTVVLENFSDDVHLNLPERRETLTFSEARKKRLLVFVTATFVDEHGQPLHSANEMPMAQARIPPQATP